MSSTVFLSLLLATFVCIGLVLAIVMGRLGYNSFTWGVLGLLLGPIGLLLAVALVREGRPSWSRLVAGGHPGSGPVDVLIGIDGSRESLERQAQALQDTQRERRQSDQAQQTIRPALVMRSGQPAAVLDQMAVEMAMAWWWSGREGPA